MYFALFAFLSPPLSFSLGVSYRPVAKAMDPVDQRVKPVEVELSRNLQTYLQRLGLLPKTPSAASLSAPGKVRDLLVAQFALSGSPCYTSSFLPSLYYHFQHNMSILFHISTVSHIFSTTWLLKIPDKTILFHFESIFLKEFVNYFLTFMNWIRPAQPI